MNCTVRFHQYKKEVSSNIAVYEMFEQNNSCVYLEMYKSIYSFSVPHKKKPQCMWFLIFLLCYSASSFNFRLQSVHHMLLFLLVGHLRLVGCLSVCRPLTKQERYVTLSWCGGSYYLLVLTWCNCICVWAIGSLCLSHDSWCRMCCCWFILAVIIYGLRVLLTWFESP